VSWRKAGNTKYVHLFAVRGVELVGADAVKAPVRGSAGARALGAASSAMRDGPFLPCFLHTNCKPCYLKNLYILPSLDKNHKRKPAAFLCCSALACRSVLFFFCILPTTSSFAWGWHLLLQ